MDEYTKILKIIEDGAKLALINLDEELIIKYSLTIDYAVIKASKEVFNKCKSSLENSCVDLGNSDYINAKLFLFRRPISITGNQKLSKLLVTQDEKSNLELLQIGFISSSLQDMLIELHKKKEHVSKLEKIGKYKVFSLITDSLEINFVDKPIAQEEQLTALKNLYEKESENKLRVMADFQNFKKRMEAQQKELSYMANKQLLNQVIDIVDDCNRALNNAGHDGVQLIIDKLKYLLTDQGLEEISVEVGERFNPEIMEAVATTPVQEGQSAGSVVHIDQLGYIYQNSKKIYRPVRVIIAK